MTAPRPRPAAPGVSEHGDEQPLVIGGEMLARRERTGERSLDGRVDFEHGMSYFPPFTLALIAALVAAYAWQEMSGALRSKDAIIAAGALARGPVLAGESWRLVTAAFLHGSPDHLLGNCVSLYILGMACEHAYGTVRTIAMYTAAMLAGSWVSVLHHPGPSVGASGAIFGLMGALAIVLFRWRHVYHVRDGRIGVVIVAWAAWTLFIGTLNPVVDNSAHVGGLLAGAIVGLAFRPLAVSGGPPSSRTPSRPAFARRLR